MENNLIKMTEAEVEICKANRDATIARIQRLVEDSASEHLAHNLASAASDLAGYQASLRQTERVLAAMRANLALAPEAK